MGVREGPRSEQRRARADGARRHSDRIAVAAPSVRALASHACGQEHRQKLHRHATRSQIPRTRAVASVTSA
eukprot:4772222-Pleurochrysis_carterae.AAC.1